MNRAVGGMVDFRAQAGKIPDNPVISCGARKKRNARKWWKHTEEQHEEFERPHLGQFEQ